MAVKLVLLHSPLVGPATWRWLAPELRARGFEIASADFRADMAGDPPYYAKLVRTARALLAPAPDTSTFLVVHSGAGSLVPALAADVAGAIFVDALMPHPGRLVRDCARVAQGATGEISPRGPRPAMAPLVARRRHSGALCGRRFLLGVCGGTERDSACLSARACSRGRTSKRPS